MALRDALNAANQRMADDARREADKPRIIADWKNSILEFNGQVHTWLAPFIQDGSIAVRKYEETYREDYLGFYTAQALDLAAGRLIVCIKPLGRMIFGAQGRIDMFRQGRNTDDGTFRFLHMKDRGEVAERWFVRRPEPRTIHRGMRRGMDLQPLTQQVFESALEELLA